jgi:heme exporter protein A
MSFSLRDAIVRSTMTLQAHHIACQRGGRTLFSGIDLAVAPGEALWVSGANGRGKSSLLRILCGLTPPAAGAVHWRGSDIRRARDDYHRDLFYCGHAPGLKDDLPAWRNIDVARRIAGQPGGIADARRALALFGLEHALHLPCAVLSQGQRKRVALARLALAPRPALLILDEPFSALDKDSVAALHGLLERHLLEGGSIVYTTHQELALGARRLHRLDLDGSR